jgi:diketogulonate reductase-like aldo/keto reductase
MAYSPVGQGKLLSDRKLVAVAREAGVMPAQLALAWVLTRPQVIAIPQSSNVAHIGEIRAAATIRLDENVIRALDAAFPPPRDESPLSVI